MDVDEAGRDGKAAGVDHPPPPVEAAHLHDAPAGDADVPVIGGEAAPVDDASVLDQQVVGHLRHSSVRSGTAGGGLGARIPRTAAARIPRARSGLPPPRRRCYPGSGRRVRPRRSGRLWNPTGSRGGASSSPSPRAASPTPATPSTPSATRRSAPSPPTCLPTAPVAAPRPSSVSSPKTAATPLPRSTCAAPSSRATGS